MSGLACIDEGHARDDQEIREYMSGKLCRCGAEPTRRRYDHVRDQSAQVSEDRRLAPDIRRLAEHIRNGSLRVACEPIVDLPEPPAYIAPPAEPPEGAPRGCP
jgi:hypothetical protein